MKKFKIEVKELGRNKIEKTVEADTIDYDTLYKVVKPHLCSDSIEFSGVIEGNWGNIIVGGFRTVGKIRFSKISK